MEFTEKQHHILDVAEELFAQNGFNGTSVRDIAKEAGVNIAMISYYFGSKEKMLEALFIRRANDVKIQIEGILNDAKLDSLAKVYKLIDGYIDRIMRQTNFHKIMVREQIGTRENEISQLIKETKQRNKNLVASIIYEGQKKGVFRKGVDIPLLMTTLFGTCNQMLTTSGYYKESNNLQHMSDEEFATHIRKKLSTHLKKVFKAILTNED
ncbi:MAG: TetR/AcrR family transcriptional regulator [Chitinophagales bacterium]|nr:TetR/AcrR family transcriptional regulator [Chitinophagales bacterium]